MSADPFAARFPLPPNATIGILGGGQLGRMSALAAAELGYRCHIYAPGDNEPGMLVSAARTVAGYEDEQALVASPPPSMP
jgi:5-(carboxyamino)imidazole ribonucleotide synthase